MALALRLAAVGLVWDWDRPPFAYEHGEIATNLVEGRGFAVRFLGAEGPTSQQAPFYPCLVALCYWLFGAGSGAALLAIELAQCLAGAATALLISSIAWSLLPERREIGWTAGWLAALSPSLIYSATHIQVVAWATLGHAATTALAVAPARRAAAKAVALGAAFGGLLLIEPIFLVVAPVLGCLARDSSFASWSKQTRPIALFACATAVVVAPWTWRNYQVHRELVFVKSTFGYAFWQGNNAQSWGTDKIPKPGVETLRWAHSGAIADAHQALWDARHETLYIDNVLLNERDYARLASLSEPERSRRLARSAWRDVAHDPLRYGQLCLRRLRYFWLFDATNPKAANLVYRAATVGWLALLVAGLLLLRRDWRRLWPVLSIIALVALFHALVITAPRFRMPVEALSLVVCAGVVRAPAGVVPHIERWASAARRG